MIEVEQSPLRALKKNVFAVACGFMDGSGAIHHMRGEAFSVSQIFTDDLLSIQWLFAIDGFEQLILLAQRPFKPISQSIFVEQVENTDATSLRLVCVGGADAAAGCADFAFTSLLFHRQIQEAVVRHRDVRR